MSRKTRSRTNTHFPEPEEESRPLYGASKVQSDDKGEGRERPQL